LILTAAAYISTPLYLQLDGEGRTKAWLAPGDGEKTSLGQSMVARVLLPAAASERYD